MWSRLREAVAGMAEQAGIEVPGLDSAASAVTDLAASAEGAVSGVVAEVGAGDVVGSVSDLAGPGAASELVTGAADAAASTGESVSGVVGGASTTADGLLEALKDRLAP